MNTNLYNTAGLRFWNETEIKLREQLIGEFAHVMKGGLRIINPAWTFHRVEGPALTPRSLMPSYGSEDVFMTNHEAAGETLALRAETTPSSYAYARHLMDGALKFKPPICVWQAGRSYRRELNDGATAAKLRFNEFWQLEFQCIYSIDTKADYRLAVMDRLAHVVNLQTNKLTRVAPSERLPSYSESTFDIEAVHDKEWRELASVSIRTDFADNMRVLEVAIGLDRMVVLAMEARVNRPQYFNQESQRG